MFARPYSSSRQRTSPYMRFLRRRPIYWRRLVAASHASLIVRTCGITDDDFEEIDILGDPIRAAEEYYCPYFATWR